MKQLKLWVLGLSMVLAGCQTTTHLSAALKPQTTEAYARPVDQPLQELKMQNVLLSRLYWVAVEHEVMLI